MVVPDFAGKTKKNTEHAQIKGTTNYQVHRKFCFIMYLFCPYFDFANIQIGILEKLKNQRKKIAKSQRINVFGIYVFN